MNGTISQSIKRVVRAWRKASREAEVAYRAGNEIMLGKLLDEALKETPIRPPPVGGTLRRSGYWKAWKYRGQLKGKVAFNAPYAWYVHEINRNYRNGNWKYLENPAKRMLPMWEKLVGSEVTAILRK